MTWCLRIVWMIALAQAGQVVAADAAIASAHPLATEAGHRVLARGGNAFDAAVAVSAALAVVEPYGSGLGGGGFWLLHRARDRFQVMIDGREKAPLAARRNMFLDNSGKPVARASLDGPLAAAIPGTPAALVLIARKYGRLPLAMSLQPAIQFAKNGFIVDARYQRMTESRLALFNRLSPTAPFVTNGQALSAGSLLRQPELAATLQEISQRGVGGFYRGRVATELIESVRAAGGIWSYADLANYRAIERKPVSWRFRNVNITTAGLPSSAGATMAQALNILEPLPLESARPTQRIHWIAEAFRRAYQDRARYLGDSDFVSVPTARLMSKNYAAERAATISPDNASSSLDFPITEAEPANTTHFSIIDRAGNRVAATMSLNTAFGSGYVAGNTGVVLNNEMDDFAAAAGVANTYGLVGSQANAIQPGKRPLSSMAPTFVEDRRGVMVLGTPGGSRIISMVALAILDYSARREPDMQALLAAPRIHHQYLPDAIELEPASYDIDAITDLELRGHVVKHAATTWGNMQIVYHDKATHTTRAFSDPRATKAQLGF